MLLGQKRIVSFLLSLAFLSAGVCHAAATTDLAVDQQVEFELADNETMGALLNEDAALLLESDEPELSTRDIRRLNRKADRTDRWRHYKSTRLKEIVRWVDLRGGQYVLGYGIDKDTGREVPFAVYDKTFPRPIYGHFWQSLVLSTSGIGDANLGGLANEFEKLAKHHRQDKAGKYVYELVFGEKGGNVFPVDWWKKEDLHWMPGKAPDVNGIAPERIPLSDLDLDVGPEKVREFRKRFKRLFVHFHKTLNDEDDTEDDASVQSTPTQEIHRKHLVYDAEFVQQADGTYRLIVAREKRALPPTKVIDLKAKFSSLPLALAWAVMTQASKQLVNYIHITELARFSYAVFERFFNLVEVIYLTRHAMALNMVMEAIEGNPASPFHGVLSTDQLQDAVTYLRRSSTMLSDLIYNLFSSNWTLAEKYIRNAEKARERSLAFLERHNYTVYQFANSYYALGVRKNAEGDVRELRVFSLIKSRVLRKRPHTVVDFLHPLRERIKRNIFETGLIASAFLPLPVPFLISLVRIFYKEVFIREIHRRQMVEAGFRAHLNHNYKDLTDALEKEGYSKIEAKEHVNRAYDIIYKRELNPIDLRRQDEAEYTRRVEKWIKNREPDYEPIQANTMDL